MNDETQLIVLMGLPGSGKSYAADLLADRGFVVVSGEDVAHELFGNEQLRSDQFNEVYSEVRKRACGLLEQGKKVVIDGTNLKRAYRQQIYNACDGYPTQLIYLKVDRATALQRIREREQRGEGSECDEQAFADFEKQLEVPDGAESAIEVVSNNDVLIAIDKIFVT